LGYEADQYPLKAKFRVGGTYIHCVLFHGVGKGKVHPITDHEGPEVEYRYSSTLSLTPAPDGSGWSMPHLGCFTPEKDLVRIV